MRTSCLASILVVAFLGGCPTTVTCPAGSTFTAGVCIVGDSGPPEEDAGPEDDAPDARVIVDAGPCAGACGGTTPHCDEGADGGARCVECLVPGDCTSPDLACIAGLCEECDDAADCTTPDASTCEAATHTCVSCTTSADCAHLTDTTICDDTGVAGVCVECTAGDESACGATSCNPATFECTTTPRTTVRRCGACVADSECMNADDRCVAMQFMAAAHGSYCLKQADMGGCVAPYGVPTPGRASLSGAAAEVYCGVNETVTTCEAVLDLSDGTTCTTDDDCGATGLADGQCETVNFMANRCSYGCTSSTFCPSGFLCPAMTYCGSP